MGTADTCYFHFSAATLKIRSFRTDCLGLCVCAGLSKINLGLYSIVLTANSLPLSLLMSWLLRLSGAFVTWTSNRVRLGAIKTYLTITMKTCPVLRSETHLRLLVNESSRSLCLFCCLLICLLRKKKSQAWRSGTLPVPVEGFHWLLNHWLRHLSGDQWEGVTGQSSTQGPQDSMLSSSISHSLVDG